MSEVGQELTFNFLKLADPSVSLKVTDPLLFLLWGTFKTQNKTKNNNKKRAYCTWVLPEYTYTIRFTTCHLQATVN